MTITSEKHHCYTNNNNNNNGKLPANNSNHNEDEIEVSNILLDLPFLITKTLSSHRFAYNWNTKKPRSALVPPPSPPPRKAAQPPVKISTALETSSPTTPLNFSPSDSDIKSMHCLSKKRKPQGLNSRKKELEAALQERMSTQETLKDSIEKVNLYLNKLMVENSELKAKKQKLQLVNLGDEGEKTITPCTPQMQPLIQLQTTQVNDPVHAGAPKSTQYHHQIPEVNDSLYASPSTSTAFQHHGPLINHHHHHQYPFHYPSPLIPHQQYAFMINNQADQQRQRENYQFDLNIVPEDEYKAMAAVARQKRFHVNKEKKARGKR